MPFPQAPVGARWILGGCQRSDWLCCCGRSCWWCPRRMAKRSSPAGSGRGRRGPVIEGYKVVALLLKQSLGLFGLVGQRRVLLPHPGSATGHRIAAGDHHTAWEFHQWLPGPFRWTPWSRSSWRCPQPLASAPPPPKGCPMRWACPQALNRPDLHFEGAGNGPVVKTWIGREHELYSSSSPISLVEHCVTFRHDRRLLSLLGFLHNLPASRWSATKKENWFSLNENGIMSSFLGRQFQLSTPYKQFKNLLISLK